MAKRKKTTRTQQFAKFVKRELGKTKVRKSLKISTKRLTAIMEGRGKRPTRKQTTALRNLARKTAVSKAKSLGFTPKMIKAERGKPILLLARARGLNKAFRVSQKVSWQKAADMLEASLGQIDVIKGAKKIDAAWMELRKLYSAPAGERSFKFKDVKRKNAKRKK